jgi:hypothetical protein
VRFHHLRRVVVAVAALGISGAATVGVLAADVPPAHAADSRAVVVIDTGGGARRSVISFSGTITGLQALQLAGANPVTYGYPGQGSAVCALDGVGHDATQGACLGTLADPRYWTYFRSPAGSSGWTYSRGCACTTTVHDGDVEGWRFGTGQAPPYSSFCAVAGCAPPPTAPPPTTAAPPPPSVQGTSVAAPAAGGSGTTGSSGATGTGAGKSATNGSSNGSVTTAPGAASDPSTTGAGGRSPGSTTSDPNGRDRGGSDQRASAGSGGSGSGGDPGGGSPWGVVGAVVLVGGLAGGGWWLRRRRVAAPPST